MGNTDWAMVHMIPVAMGNHPLNRLVGVGIDHPSLVGVFVPNHTASRSTHNREQQDAAKQPLY